MEGESTSKISEMGGFSVVDSFGRTKEEEEQGLLETKQGRGECLGEEAMDGEESTMEMGWEKKGAARNSREKKEHLSLEKNSLRCSLYFYTSRGLQAFASF